MLKYNETYETFEREGKTGKIVYCIRLVNGVPASASSSYNKEDGCGSINACIRILNPNGPTVRKLLGRK